MFHIIKYTLIENLRSKIYFSAIGLLMLISLISWIGSAINYNFGDLHLTILAFGMNLTELLVIAIALFLPVSHLSIEYEKGSAQVIWAKLNSKATYFCGKYFSFLILIFSLIFISALFIGFISVLAGCNFKQILFLNYFIFGLFLESACILSLVFFLYAVLRSPVVTSLLSLLIIYFAVFLDTAQDIAIKSQNLVIKVFYGILYFGMPNMSYFNFENQIIYQQAVTVSFLLTILLYSLIFSGVLLTLGNIITDKREL